jgi:aminoglycoside phosphotransferase family enzyme
MQDKNKNSQPMSDGFRVMAREKALAEQFLAIMNDFGRKDMTQYVRGVTLYAEAKAEFDGLLTELEHELEQAMAPNQSEKFAAVLEEAVACRLHVFRNRYAHSAHRRGHRAAIRWSARH